METLTMGQISLTLAFLVALIGSVSFLMARTKAWILSAVRSEIDRLDGKIDDTARMLDEMSEKRLQSHADQARRRALTFNDELLRHVQHSKESFDQILIDIDDYEDYCRTHRDYQNNQAVMAIANIKRCYQQCNENSSFLQ